MNNVEAGKVEGIVVAAWPADEGGNGLVVLSAPFNSEAFLDD